MSNPIYALIEKYAGPRFARQAAGIVEDFWKDTQCEFPTIELKLLGRSFKVPNVLKPMPLSSPSASHQPLVSGRAPKVAAEAAAWHALPGELAEKMWGEEQILPAGDEVMTMLTASLGLNREKNIVDLSAGLGGPFRKLAGVAGQMKGFEIDPGIAMRGMKMSADTGKGKLAPIEAYDPATFTMPTVIDCVIARELFYRIADKAKFFYVIGAGVKTRGHVVFTDYIVDPENRDRSSIKAWQANEANAKPLGLIEMAEAWAKVGFELKVSEDQTPFYRKELTNGVSRFVAALKLAPQADAETKKTILAEVEIWIHRLAAIQQGMKFYRFDAIKS